MSINLFRDLGLDESSAEVKNARLAAEVYEQVISTLVEARKECGLKQREVASRMRTTQSAVSSLESLGADARFSTLIRYAQAVNCEVLIEIVKPGGTVTVPVPDDAWGSVAVSAGWRFGEEAVTGPVQWTPGDTVDELFESLPGDAYRTFKLKPAAKA